MNAVLFVVAIPDTDTLPFVVRVLSNCYEYHYQAALYSRKKLIGKEIISGGLVSQCKGHQFKNSSNCQYIFIATAQT